MSGLGAEGMASKGRGLSVSTLLVVVAAIAVGLAVTRTLPDFLFLDQGRSIFYQHYPSPRGGVWGSYHVGVSPFLGGSNRLVSSRRPSYWLDHVPYWLGPCLASLTLTTLVFGMRFPKSPRRAARFSRRVVGMTILLAMAAKFAESLALFAIGWHSMAATWAPTTPWRIAVNGPWAYFWLTLPGPVAFGVVIGWTVLKFGGRRSAAPDSWEWLSRIIGWCWIALALSRVAGSLCLGLGY